ncbi:hypothetical protein SAICODRAFT_182689 [Saitoella complicata NRRL Y-17804]|uniref:uncharacterized protein n=1 Tax=Saitoella complicata (strain BCRC 22490 / CBS 7301 / JCM 7358 / NBRC 10748 / NRRL Y-17804) TaxID=698492 RepID=UPI00086813ED|nr:uncharacterized protein SAICODRAFT_182689 [Saitoella complicata NRRL Y-17804]ODQ55277.1 hypothetical protein SAICODRAFT_182689 [Saitoella complicata NRRL Y-17804]
MVQTLVKASVPTFTAWRRLTWYWLTAYSLLSADEDWFEEPMEKITPRRTLKVGLVLQTHTSKFPVLTFGVYHSYPPTPVPMSRQRLLLSSPACPVASVPLHVVSSTLESALDGRRDMILLHMPQHGQNGHGLQSVSLKGSIILLFFEV